jgi:exodeoxyribonuclease-3
MQIATWNVNSLKVRLNHVVDWLGTTNCDVLGLQELKLDNLNNQQLESIFANLGYTYVYNGQKTYNGVGILSRQPLMEISYDIPEFNDEQKRVIAATTSNGIRIICAYFVNGEAVGSSKYEYKLAWLEAFIRYVANEIVAYPHLVVLGDYNIAPEARDTYDPALWEGQILCSPPERQAFQGLLNLGLVDSFRAFNQDERQYTWWDYRNLAFRRKQGLRIDHLLASLPVMDLAANCHIDVAPRKLERPSDHTPLVLTLREQVPSL